MSMMTDDPDLVSEIIGGATKLTALSANLSNRDPILGVAMLLHAAAALAMACDMSRKDYSEGVIAAWESVDS